LDSPWDSPAGHGFTEEQRDRYVAEIARCIQVAKDMEQQEVGRWVAWEFQAP